MPYCVRKIPRDLTKRPPRKLLGQPPLHAVLNRGLLGLLNRGAFERSSWRCDIDVLRVHSSFSFLLLAPTCIHMVCFCLLVHGGDPKLEVLGYTFLLLFGAQQVWRAGCAFEGQRTPRNL